MSISRQLKLGAVIISVMVFAAGYMALRTGQEAVLRQIGQNSLDAADEITAALEQKIENRLEQVAVFAADLIRNPELLESNRFFATTEEPRQFIDDVDEAWQQAVLANRPNEMILRLSNSDLSEKIRAQFEYRPFFRQRYGHSLWRQSIATNTVGTVVAQTETADRFSFADALWWRQAKAAGRFVGHVAANGSGHGLTLTLSKRIGGPGSDFRGVFKTELDLGDITGVIETVAGRGMDAPLISLYTTDLRSLYCSSERLRNAVMPASVRDRLMAARTNHYFVTGSGEGQWDNQFVACAYSKQRDDWDGFGWVVLIHQDTADVLAPVNRLRKTIFGISLITVAACLLVLFTTSRSFSASVSSLRRTASRFGGGNRDHPAAPGGNEIDRLNLAFIRLGEELVSATTAVAQYEDEIIELKKAEEAFKQSQADFHAVVANSPSGIVVVDNEGNVLYTNPIAENLFMKSKVDVHGQLFGQPLARCERTQVDIIRDSGEAAVAEITITPTDWHGKNALLVSLIDITANVEAKRILKKANDELLDLNRMKSEFLSVASHELRTPLTSIKSSVSTISSGKTGPLSENQERFLAIATNNINRLASLIDNLLDLSRLEAQKFELKPMEIDLGDLFSQIIADFTPQARDKQQTLTKNCPPELPRVYADKTKIEQVLFNLVGNAIKFTPDKGAISLAAAVVDGGPVATDGHRTIRKGSFAALQYVEIAVVDTGRGIEPKDQQSIFHPFHRGEDSQINKVKGSGLGLSITKSLLEAHEEQIFLTSEPGKGSRFFFYLPVFSTPAVECVRLITAVKPYMSSPPFVIIAAVLESGAAGDAAADAAAISAAIGELKAAVGKTVYREKDHVILHQGLPGVLIILGGTGMKGGEIVKGKIEALQLADVRVTGPVSYPEDGVRLGQLLEALQTQP